MGLMTEKKERKRTTDMNDPMRRSEMIGSLKGIARHVSEGGR